MQTSLGAKLILAGFVAFALVPYLCFRWISADSELRERQRTQQLGSARIPTGETRPETLDSSPDPAGHPRSEGSANEQRPPPQEIEPRPEDRSAATASSQNQRTWGREQDTTSATGFPNVQLDKSEKPRIGTADLPNSAHRALLPESIPKVARPRPEQKSAKPRHSSKLPWSLHSGPVVPGGGPRQVTRVRTKARLRPPFRSSQKLWRQSPKWPHAAARRSRVLTGRLRYRDLTRGFLIYEVGPAPRHLQGSVILLLQDPWLD